VDENNQKVNFGVAVPGLLSFLISGTTEEKVSGLNSIPVDERPPVNIVFQSYHLMVSIGFALIGITLLGIFFWWRGTLFEKKWMLWIFVFSVLGPQLANQLGWITAEVGRQPWIVYGILRTSEGLSKTVESGQVLFSLILFAVIYSILFVLFIYLLNEKIKHGPEDPDTLGSEYEHQKVIFNKKT
jgi:cytochrome d ubiquinol oxidase subunit I